MTMIFILLTVQSLLGAFDNFWHHEREARLPQRTSARYELRLHAAREAIYGLLFASFAWLQWSGWWVVLPAGLLVTELFITIADFLEEDRSRKLPPLERALHTVLAVSYGLLVGLVGPLFWQAAQDAPGVVVVTHGWWTVLFSLASAGVLLWSLRNALAVHKLGAMLEELQAAPAAHGALRQGLGQSTVLVTGGTGFVGQALVQRLLHEGRRVLVLSRDPLQARAALGQHVWVMERLDDIPCETRIDAVVNLAGAAILGAPWTRGRRLVLLQSRLQVADQVQALIQRLQHRPEVLVCASAVGYYGLPAHHLPLDEAAPAEPGRFQSELCAQIEAAAQRNQALGLRVVCLRPGIVLGHGDGAFPALAFAARMGLSAVLAGGRQPMPWIHLDDAVGLICHALTESALHGPLNAVAPQAVTQQQFARALATAVQRPQWLSLPAWPLKLALGEMSELLLSGQNVVPAAALRSGYRFRHPFLAPALVRLSAPLRHAGPQPETGNSAASC
ncbi:TIGR01777 family oxidoreductase [Comamonas composti]|uniref:TIGR01777 family oxidoreductase n=1 Tax=Comamonas composti TaxID=408558 RepID=UPI0003F8F5EC|nr:TIGR01777 family oxidoreductase [Comamonas composti]